MQSLNHQYVLPQDRNSTLWCGFLIRTKRHTIFFPGDTGYRTVAGDFQPSFGPAAEVEERTYLARTDEPTCPVFRTLGESVSSIDLALLPIGAYSPRAFMSTSHINPLDAVQIHCELRAKKSIACHWGTFILSDEPVFEPVKRLAREVQRAGLDADAFVAIPHGATVTL